MVRLFRAKQQLFEKHWPSGAARFGGWMLATGALTRMLGNGVLYPAGDAFREAHRAWRSIWGRRGEYMRRQV